MPQSLAHGRTVESLDIVLIDDHRGSQSVLRSMIGSFRVRRLRAYDSAKEALKEMLIDPPSLVVTEWAMRPVSGFRLTRAMRARSMAPLCFVPIVAITSNATLSMVEQAFSVGANAVMVKPVSPAALRQRLDWATRDDRGFVVDGDGYAVAGINNVLHARGRRRGAGRSAPTTDDPPPRPAETGAGIAPPSAEPPSPEPASGKPDTWNSWAMT